MQQLNFFVVTEADTATDAPIETSSVFRTAFNRVFPNSDTSFQPSRIHFVYRCETYLRWPGWAEVLVGLRMFRGNLAERRIAVTQFVFAHEEPSRETIDRECGFWFDVEYMDTGLGELDAPSLHAILHDTPSRRFGRWLVVPFADANDDTELYEEGHPAEGTATFGRAVNVPARFTLPRAGLRVRTVRGTRLGDYVRSAYAGMLVHDESTLGGQNVIATTLFQMNDRLELVNHFNEKREQQEDLNLLSFSALQMEPVDDRDDTNIAVLLRRGSIRVRNVLLGA